VVSTSRIMTPVPLHIFYWAVLILFAYTTHTHRDMSLNTQTRITLANRIVTGYSANRIAAAEVYHYTLVCLLSWEASTTPSA
jgi:hypothetical protein